MEERIYEVKNKWKKIQSAKRYIKEIEERQLENQEKLEKALEQLRKEDQDVEKLKRASLTSILAHFTHDLEERVMKEEAEAMHVAVYVKQLQAEQESLDYEYQRYLELIQEEEAVTVELQALQVSYLQSHNKEESDHLKKLHEQQEESRMVDKEISEAIAAGMCVLEKLGVARKELGSAQGWGIFDIMGGGVLSTMVKHSHVNEAQRYIADIKNDLLRFKKEVDDIGELDFQDVEMSGGLVMFDYIFDNVFTDFMVQSKINDSLRSVEEMESRLRAIMDHLEALKKENNQTFTSAKEAYEEVLQKI